MERLRQMVSDRQPYRCHHCGWRKWREVEVHPDNADVHPDDLRTGRQSPPIGPGDLDKLDAVDPSSPPV
jgi:hypothetical protein